ncbi:MAG: cellulase family glycosylhydrolase [Anaerolineales bacterium]|nr:cellulase family glycosylhydrolase [Anaerolineales bacterium]
MRKIVILLLVALSLSACGELEDIDEIFLGEDKWETEEALSEVDLPVEGVEQIQSEEATAPTEVLSTPEVSVGAGETTTKYDLWRSEQTLLRGANIWQALVIPDLDGPEFKGGGAVGPPITQADFDRLAALGANYVTISGPGIFTERAPYQVDAKVVALYDDLLQKAANADLFVTIAFRTGPGRSEYGLCCFEEDWARPYLNDRVWEDDAAKDAWVEMWRYAAERYRDNPIIVGYKLMVEPNDADILLDIWDAEEFYPQHAGSNYDWNVWYPKIVQGIRAVDVETPILVGGMSYSRVAWLPYLEPMDDPYIVYVIHQYAPAEYTQQEPGENISYPDEIWGETFNQAWLENLLSTVDDFAAETGAPVAVDEFGVVRWAPNAVQFMDDSMSLFEERGMNHSLWEWSASYEPFVSEVNAFTFGFGPEVGNTNNVPNGLMDVIVAHWSQNTIRPSGVDWGK